MTIILKLDINSDLCISFEKNDSLILEAINDNTYVSISTIRSYNKFYNNMLIIFIIIFIICHILYIYCDNIFPFITVNKTYYINLYHEFISWIYYEYIKK
jgi:hypothetical protein